MRRDDETTLLTQPTPLSTTDTITTDRKEAEANE